MKCPDFTSSYTQQTTGAGSFICRGVKDGSLLITISVATKLVRWVRYLRSACSETQHHL